MQKIMFNDRLGLTKAVLNGVKRQTRRTVPLNLYNATDWGAFSDGIKECTCFDGNMYSIFDFSTYKVGEVVAIAQSYRDISNEVPMFATRVVGKEYRAGWGNKMFVKSELMQHHIRITGVRVQHLQDVSDEDILKEGVTSYLTHGVDDAVRKYTFEGSKTSFFDARSAFAALIDRVSGKGTWDSNPWVFAYDIDW